MNIDWLDIHNDDMIPVSEYEGIIIYSINYEQAEKRCIEYIRNIIKRREEKENDN